MPHISLKMLKGRTPAQKEQAAEALSAALQKALGVGPSHITVSIEDFTPEEWQTVFQTEVTDKPDAQYVQPGYDPKDLL
jgi:phenylpyruvate tautomerase PptA (4-oxalocrotonate tautomerase family)